MKSDLPSLTFNRLFGEWVIFGFDKCVPLPTSIAGVMVPLFRKASLVNNTFGGDGVFEVDDVEEF